MTSQRRYPRTARLNEVILETLADELERLSDPRLELVTLTGVDVSRDLSHATVYYSSLAATGAMADPEAAANTATALASAAPHLRGTLGRQVRARQVPKLTFEQDPAIISGHRIEEILRDIHRDEAENGHSAGESE